MSTLSVHAVTADPVAEPPEARRETRELARFLASHEAPVALLGPDGEQIPLPLPVYDVLRQAVAAMDRGASVNIEPVDRQLTTQQAANILGISRNTLVRMLENRELPFERFGNSRHRRLRLHDVLEYRQRTHVDRRSRLDEITRQASEDGLYDVDSAVYRDALAEARKS